MGYATVRETLENAKLKIKDEGLREIAQALIELSKAIENDIRRLGHEIHER